MQAAATTSTTPAPVSFEFVVGNRPDQLKGGSSKRLRSHLSKQSWKVHLLQQQHKLSSSSSSSDSPSPASAEDRRLQQQRRQQQHQQQEEERAKRRRRKRRQHAVTFELEVDPEAGCGETPLGINATDLGRALIRDNLADEPAWPLILPIDYLLGGGRVDPFRSYPGPWKPYIPRLVDHYIVHMAVDIPELDQPGNQGLLRSRWFRLATTEVSTFQVIMLLAAGNFITVKGGVASELGFQMLQLKLDAITSINAAFHDEDKRLSDSLIGAIAKMASFEAMHGDEASFRMHMEGLTRMVQMRGGLHNLGLGGLLRRMIIWIDLNGGFLLQTPRYFPGQTFAGHEEDSAEPNPERFIAM